MLFVRFWNKMNMWERNQYLQKDHPTFTLPLIAWQFTLQCGDASSLMPSCRIDSQVPPNVTP